METFTYLAGFSTLILGLAVTKLLQGLADLTEERARIHFYWLPVGWMIGLLAACAWEWWMILRWRTFADWTFGHFVFLLLKPAILFYLASLSAPRFSGEGRVDLEEHYFRVHRYFFVLFSLFLLLDLVDTALKGMDYFRSFGIGYPIAVAAQAAIQLSAVFVRRRTWHVVVGVCAWSGFLLSYFTGTLSL